MSSVLLGFEVGWIIIGSIFAAWWDDDQMKKHVPFGEAPAILPLSTLRLFSFVLFTVVGPGLLLAGLVVVSMRTLYSRYRLWLAVHRLRSTVKKIGPHAETLLDEIVKGIKSRR